MPLHEIEVHKASPLPGEVTPDLIIAARHTFPLEDTPEEGDARHEVEAVAIVDALYATLPGGTLDRIFAELAHRKASRLRVAHMPSSITVRIESPSAVRQLLELAAEKVRS